MRPASLTEPQERHRVRACPAWLSMVVRCRWWTAGGSGQFLQHVPAFCCRAGCGSAQDYSSRRFLAACGVSGSLQGFHQGQGSTAPRGAVEVFRALSLDRVQQFVVELIVASLLAISSGSRGCGFIESSAEAEFGDPASRVRDVLGPEGS